MIMKAYRFTTKVTHSGIIQIPNKPSLFDKEVEIIIMPKPTPEKEKMKAKQFVKKWDGFLSDSDTDKSKFDYLSNKYK